MKNKLLILLISSLVFILTACQSVSTKPKSDSKNQPHLLINKIWSISEQKFVSEKRLIKRMLNNHFIYLGETHDNKRHHQLQAQMIEHLLKNDQSPVIAFEMLDQKRQVNIDEFQNKITSSPSSEQNVKEFTKLIEWEKSGWPEWSYYEPVFQISINNKLPILATNLEIKKIRNVIKQGSQILDKSYQQLLKKYQYEPVLKAELEKEILSAHCDMLPEKMLAPMLLGQQVRDLAMTQALLSTLPEVLSATKLVLIAGSGHTRTDYGIPYYIQQEKPELKTLSLSFLEVNEGENNPEDYAQIWSETAKTLPFDFVWFTEKSPRDDQCEKMRAYMKKKKQKEKEE